MNEPILSRNSDLSDKMSQIWKPQSSSHPSILAKQMCTEVIEASLDGFCHLITLKGNATEKGMENEKIELHADLMLELIENILDMWPAYVTRSLK